jgi:addiction module HigA family antidote
LRGLECGNERAKPRLNASSASSIHPGEYLAEILGELSISQAAFARAVGVSPMRICHVLKGARPATAELARLARRLGNRPSIGSICRPRRRSGSGRAGSSLSWRLSLDSIIKYAGVGGFSGRRSGGNTKMPNSGLSWMAAGSVEAM